MNAWVYGERNVLVAFACPKSTSEGLPVDRVPYVPCIPGKPGIQFTVVDRLCRKKKTRGVNSKIEYYCIFGLAFTRAGLNFQK